MVAAAVITTFSAILNSTVALYAVDFHERLLGPATDRWRQATVVSVLVTLLAMLLVPLYTGAASLANLLQQLNGLTSMPILSAFIVGLLFRNVSANAAVVGILWGFLLYAAYTFWWLPAGLLTLHYIHFMVIVLASSLLAALSWNRLVAGRQAQFVGLKDVRGTAA